MEVSPKAKALFEQLENEFKDTQLGESRWYLLAIAALTGGTQPDTAADLYLFLTSQPRYSTSEARKELVRRLREALVKSISIYGVCKPIEAILAISNVERDEDRDFSCSRQAWQCDQANLERGQAWLQKIYAGNTRDTLGLFEAHRDIAWISQNITYGLYLSDRQILDDVDTQIVVLSGIMIQNLKLETHWHIRGTRRIGVSKEDVQVIWDGVQAVAKFSGLTLDRVPTVEEVQDI